MIQCLSHKLIYIIFFWNLPTKQHFIGFFNTTIKKMLYATSQFDPRRTFTPLVTFQ